MEFSVRKAKEGETPVGELIRHRERKQGRIHGSTVACCWAGAVKQINSLFGLKSTEEAIECKVISDSQTDRQTGRPTDRPTEIEGKDKRN